MVLYNLTWWLSPQSPVVVKRTTVNESRKGKATKKELMIFGKGRTKKYERSIVAPPPKMLNSGMPVCLSVCLSVCVSVCLSVYMLVCLFICTDVCMYVSLYVCPHFLNMQESHHLESCAHCFENARAFKNYERCMLKCEHTIKRTNEQTNK